MPSKELTEEEIRIIMENPYTLNVSRNKFMLTKEGKEKVLILAESGKTIRQIMIELGYDPQMLGHNRTKNIIRLMIDTNGSWRNYHQASFIVT